MDEQRIIRQYLKIQNLRIVASLNKTSAETVKKIVLRNGYKLADNKKNFKKFFKLKV